MKQNNLSNLKTFEKNKLNYSHVGDIEYLKVLKNNNIYLLIGKDDKTIAFFEVFKINSNICMLNDAFIIKEFENNKIFEVFCWFLKRYEEYSTIKLNSKFNNIDMIKTLGIRFDIILEDDKNNKKLGICFEMNWEKNKENSREFHNKKIIDKFYYALKTNNWHIILENDGDFSDWPKFFDFFNIKSYYFNFFDDLSDFYFEWIKYETS